MEFNQFHPTCLYHPHCRQLFDFRGSPWRRRPAAPARWPSASCNGSTNVLNWRPRDIVARAIDHEMKRLWRGLCVSGYQSPDLIHLLKLISQIYSIDAYLWGLICAKIHCQWCPQHIIPVAVVLIDRHGRTDLPNLFAVGEVSYSGLHGANRLASKFPAGMFGLCTQRR